jgi:ribosome-associated heat shock protein Hsp15
MDKVRIDKFLWAVRLYKTRSQAASECSKGRVQINSQIAKPSREVKIGDVIQIKYKVITRSYKVKNLLDRRVGAKLVDNYIEEITPQDELLKLKLYQEYQRTSVPRRTEKGRPTKRDRRQWDKYFGK